MTEKLKIDASRLGTSFMLDPELSLPLHPRFIPEIVTVPFGANGLIFDGVRDIQVIAGRSVRGLLPRLLPLLDGTRTIEEIQAALPALPMNGLVDAIALLYSRGLLEDGGGDAAEGALASFLGRYADVTRVNSSRTEALGRLAAQRVSLAGDGADVLGCALSGQGLAEVVRLESPDEIGARPLDFMIFAATASSPDAAVWFAAAHAAGVRALHMTVDAAKAEIGPYIIPGASACYDCFRRIVPASNDASPADPASAAFWIADIALHAFNIASRIGTSKLYNACTIHRETDVAPIFERHTLARLPGCETCGLTDTDFSGDEPEIQAWIRHFAPHNMMCKELRSPRDHQMHYSAKNLKLTGEQPQRRFGVPKVALPSARASSLLPRWTVAPQPSDRCDLPTLAAILQAAAGYQDTEQGGRRRLAPSGGGLGSADVYVIARSVAGLSPGAYRYYGWDHELEWVGPVRDAVLANALAIPFERLPPLLLVGTCDLRRIRQKYEDFSFRIGHLDNGVARQFVQDVADAAGLAVAEYADIRDIVIFDLLDLPMAGNRTMVSFAVGLGDTWVEGEPPAALDHHYQITDWLIEQSSYMGARFHARHARSPAPPTIAPHEPIPLAKALRQRRSTRQFAARPVQDEVLDALARLADDAGILRATTSGLDLPMDLLMALHMPTQGKRPGLYRWSRHHEAFECVREGLSRADTESMMQQTGYAEAAFTFFVAGDFEAALRSAGVRGYREIISRSGSMLARVQLAALSWSVVGSMWGGVAEENVGKLFDIDRYRTCPLFAASFGYADE